MIKNFRTIGKEIRKDQIERRILNIQLVKIIIKGRQLGWLRYIYRY